MNTPNTAAQSEVAANPNLSDLNQIQDILFGRQMRSYEQVLKTQAATIDALAQQLARVQQALEQERTERAAQMKGNQAAIANAQSLLKKDLSALTDKHEQWQSQHSQNSVSRQQLSVMFKSMSESMALPA